MRCSILFLSAIVSLASQLVAPAPSSAVIVNFSQALGGTDGRMASSSYTNGPITANAYHASGGNYINTNTFLFVRNEPNDHGFGVCNPNELSNSACNPPATFTGGGGELNELDNAGTKEMIRLTLADGWDWTRVWVSSLDGAEQGKLLYSSNGTLVEATVDAFPNAISPFVANSNPERSFNITGAAAAATHLYFIPGPSGKDNDYLVWKAEANQTNVPEPGTLLLLGSALTGVALVRVWRKGRG